MISYDISSDKSRRLAHQLLKDHGQRVQYSVFECRLTSQQRDSLRQSLQKLLDEGDSLRWYPLCNWCEADVDWQGSGMPLDDNDFYLI